ncbi:MAG: methyltransferase domain-containing protein [Ilumatobacteraceae bacterium]|nr:SAM-dependent methyltransferase [Acidimicrobiaceae bacterium]
MPDPEHVSTTRAAYDDTADVYAQWVGTEISSAIEGPIDRALLGAFVELMAHADGRPVADVGCGPGRVAALLAAQGLDVIGVDASPGMLAVARRTHPGIRFELGLLTDLPVPDGSLAGAVCWYSIIHTPAEHLGTVGAELLRALAPGAHLLVAFQAGNGERVHRSEVHGRPVSLTSYRHAPDEVAGCLAGAGLQVLARAVREAESAHESTPQAFILARSPTVPA